MRTSAVLIGSVLLFGACQAKKSAPAAGSGSGSGSGSAAKTLPTAIDVGNGSAGSGVAAAPNILKLPKGPGTPPLKTTGPIAKDKADAAVKLEFPGFRADIQKSDGHGIFEVRLKTIDRPRISITVVARPCSPTDCDPMDVAKWQAKTATLKQALPPTLRDLKDTTFEVGSVDVHGAPAMYTYQLAQLFGRDDNGQPVSEYSDNYTLFWNDGTNRITVVSQYADDPLGTLDMMKNVAPKEDLEKIAVAFLDIYTHAWM